MQKEKTKIKTKAISIRVSEEQEKVLKQNAERNGTSMTAYMLNRTLNETGNIYDRDFFELMKGLNWSLNYLKNHHTDRNGNKELLTQIQQLNQGVTKLWQYLK